MVNPKSLSSFTILGKWNFLGLMQEYYNDDGSICFLSLELGLIDDSLIFDSEKRLFTSICGQRARVEQYQLEGDSTIRIADKVWHIASLSHTQLEYYSQEVDELTNTKVKTSIRLRRN